MINMEVPDILMNNIKVDLHMHTTASDGTWRPDILVNNLIKENIKVFALTDHDSTENLYDTSILAKENDLIFIPGVEINTTFKQHNYHILGLGIDRTNEALQSLIKTNREILLKKDFTIIEKFEKKNTSVSREDYLSYVHNPERGGWKALNYFIDKGLCKNFKEFLILFEEDAPSFELSHFASPAQAINVIVEAGGYPILAHPGVSFYDSDYKCVIKNMLSQGIKGIECYHPENNPEITEYSLRICDENSLLITGGSDCHGDFVPTRRLGHPSILLSQLRLDGLL